MSMSGTMPTALTVAVVVWLQLAAGATATATATAAEAEPVAPGSPVPSDPVFTAELLDGTTRTGRIHQFGPHGAIALVPDDGPEEVLPLGRLLKLTREAGARALT